jgi:hypothetical protein
MVRLRNAMLALMMATGLTGCSALSALHGGGDWMARWSIFHCDTCDDFPAPTYGPGFSMMPGTYTGSAAPGSTSGAQPAASNPPAGAMPGTTPPPAITTPPLPPSAPGGLGSDAPKE